MSIDGKKPEHMWDNLGRISDEINAARKEREGKISPERAQIASDIKRLFEEAGLSDRLDSDELGDLMEEITDDREDRGIPLSSPLGDREQASIKGRIKKLQNEPSDGSSV